MPAAHPPGPLRRLRRKRLFRFALAGLLCLALPAGCVAALNTAFPDGCARNNPDLPAKALPGTYDGPGGMRLTLAANGQARVRDWPFDLYLGGTDDRRFDGRGQWSYGVGEDGGERRSSLVLDFSEGTPEDDVPPDGQTLYPSGDPDAPVLFAEHDPDTCPKVELRRDG